MMINLSTLRKAAQGPRAEPQLNESADGAIKAGLIILVLFFGGFGTWAALAPLNAAVVGEAVVKVEGNRKSVQHLDGGIVKELRVEEGDRVRKGEVLLVLDNVQLRAEVEVLVQQQSLLRAVEARLQAEFKGAPGITFPASLAAQRHDPSIAATIEDQVREFEQRRTALTGQEQVLRQRIAQLDQNVISGQARKASYDEQLKSILGEEEGLQDLFRRELITRTRLLQLDRTKSGIEAQVAEAEAETIRAQEGIGELSQQIAQLRKERMAELSGELRDTRARLQDLVPRLQSAKASLERTIVRAPYEGKVVGLSVFSIGGVVGRGERILDIVPAATSLVVEASIGVEDIADIQPGMTAEVHFTSYKQRTSPLIHGRLVEVSADRFTDERSGRAFYKVLVNVDPKELAASPHIQLYPGMPATVMVTTVARSALDYLLGPLTASFNRAFRER
jgi:HlyD family type I secretion membrane fusion protein